MRNLIDIRDMTVEEIDRMLDLADRIFEHPEQYRDTANHKTLATLFFEPSTRTRLSFEAAMLELGGRILGFSSAASSSATKGESVADTVAVVSGYCDIIAMRHPKEGAPVVAARHATVPVINAGDGGHNHPTQTLTDLMTIRREKGRLCDMNIGLCGDLQFGRTVHSLIAAMSRSPGIRFSLISPDELCIPDYVREILTERGCDFVEIGSMEEVMPTLDVLYMTRVQKERFFNEADYIRLKDSYILDPAKLSRAKDDLCVMHPLPRVNEISTLVDNDPRACYFKQARYGKYVRMALILTLLELVKEG
ncbi:MAG: aspartate carbamoyltransferase [Clostridiales bacterium]|nr:aspartate carbamoyltransferase [Clostridiales bacterium]